ncbi:MAG: hypothetical protein U0441_36090 [Polyangiaceae bacterium]
MKLGWIGLFSVMGAGLLVGGCKDACESATDRLAARYKECDIDVSTSGLASSPSAEVVCGSADGERLECLANCADSASCEAIRVEDELGAADFSACNADCR